MVAPVKPRDGLRYDVQRPLQVAPAGFDPDEPNEGFYRIRLRRGAVWSAVKIWFGPPHDPDTGEVMDRSHRWQATINGVYADLSRVWPQCAMHAVDQAEHDYLLRRQEWAREHAPDSPDADPNKPVDMLRAPLPF